MKQKDRIKEKVKKTYMFPWACSNCGENMGLRIPFGVKAVDWICKNKEICKNCGC